MYSFMTDKIKSSMVWFRASPEVKYYLRPMTRDRITLELGPASELSNTMTLKKMVIITTNVQRAEELAPNKIPSGAGSDELK